MSNMEAARLSPNRIPALPRDSEHWKWTDKPSVMVLHRRLHRKHGAASSHPCVDCGNRARDWSLIKGHEYSDNIEDYEPRCRSCHMKYDMTDEKRELRRTEAKRRWKVRGRL